MSEREIASEQKTEYEVSPELVEKIENSKLDTDSKVGLLLVKAGIKPSSSLELTIRTGENIWLTSEDLREVEAILKNSGLAFDVGEILTEGSEEDEEKKDKSKTLDTVEILISGSQDKLEHLKEIKGRLPGPQQVGRGKYTEKQRRADYKELGLAFGYPESAIEAFMNDTTIAKDDLPEDVRKSSAFVFSTFRLSKDNWQEELKQGQAWADCVGSLSPKTYNEVMERV
jgi:hypothetical protein